MNWGKWIIVSFVAFALFMGTLVTVCVRQDMSLVSSDYYKQELAYQSRIEQINNVAQLKVKPAITIHNNLLEISFSGLNKIRKCELKLFRPSNAKLDKTFSLEATADTVRLFDISTQQHGMYKVILSWAMEGKEYFIEENLYLN